jgi:hypothetical protein
MVRKLVTIVTIVLSLFATAIPASAITGNYVQDGEHPFVGLAALYNAEGRWAICSGSLLTPTVFLTAGHCIRGASSARIYFQQGAFVNYDPVRGYDPVTGFPHFCATGEEKLCVTSNVFHHYGWDGGALYPIPETRDVGLIILNTAVIVPEYGVLAAAGSLDVLATRRGLQETTFTVSGYGLILRNPEHVQPSRQRLMAARQLVNLGSALTDGYNLQVSSNPGNDQGGACQGDSGGPIFYGRYASNHIVAVTSFNISGYCRGVGFAYRTDRAEVIEWILANVPSSEVEEIHISPL